MYTLMKIHMRLGQYLHRQYDVDKKWPSIGNLTLYMCCEVKRAHTNTTLPESHDLIWRHSFRVRTHVSYTLRSHKWNTCFLHVTFTQMKHMFPTRCVHTNETHVSYTLRSHTWRTWLPTVKTGYALMALFCISKIRTSPVWVTTDTFQLKSIPLRSYVRLP